MLKVLVFNNQDNFPFQKWSQGKWHAHWTVTLEGDHLCSLYVTIATPENKIKIRKGKDIIWRPLLGTITELLTNVPSEEIQVVGEKAIHWHEMIGQREALLHTTTPPDYTAALKNPFSALFDEEENTS